MSTLEQLFPTTIAFIVIWGFIGYRIEKALIESNNIKREALELTKRSTVAMEGMNAIYHKTIEDWRRSQR